MDIEAIADSLIQRSPKKRPPRFLRYLQEYLLESYGICQSNLVPDLECFVNAQSNTYGKEPNNITGSIQLSPVRTGVKNGKKITVTKTPDCANLLFSQCRLLYDSGAFTDVLTNSRVTPEESLNRQLSTLSTLPKIPEVYLVDYDLLIDEKYIEGDRIKQRWNEKEAWMAVDATVEAAKYLDSQRSRLKDFHLVQSIQGVTPNQYLSCTNSVLNYVSELDIVGLGGWCILGKEKKWLPTFWETIDLVIPAIASSGVKRIHIFGCTWYKPCKGFPQPPLPTLLALCDRYDLRLSTDGRSPIGNALWNGENSVQKAGAAFPYWRHNLAWVKAELATLRESACYQLPKSTKQLQLF